MGPKSRLFATVFIWAVIISAGSSMDVPPGSEMLTLGIFAMIILLCMGFIWNWGRLPLSTAMSAKSGKAKRSASSKYALLRELLDDEELEAVRAFLMDDISGNHYDDGELPLEALLEQDEI